jgi:tetratricopeptide (TPR) repeat protein
LLVVGLISLVFPSAHAVAQDAMQKELAQLNVLTGNEPMQGALKGLLADKKRAHELLQFALPAAKKKEISYNAALVLALAAVAEKDLKTAEAYFRVCMDKGAKLQSYARLRESYLTVAELYYDAKKYGDCVRVCKDLLALNTDDDKEREVIPTITNRFEEPGFGEPRDRFDSAENVRPEIQEIYAKALAKQGKFDQAVKVVDNLLKNNDHWSFRELKGWVLKEAGKLDQAVEIYEDVIKAVAKDKRIKAEVRDLFTRRFRYDASNIYVELKKIDKASGHLEFLMKKYPEIPSFYNDLGYIWADNDMKLEEAEKLIRKAIDLDRDRRKMDPGFNPKTDQDPGAYLDSLGWVLFKQKKNEEAKTWLIKALEDKKAQHLEIFDHLGDVHLALGERDLAIRAWQKGLEHVNLDDRRDKERKAEVEKKLEKAKSSK